MTNNSEDNNSTNMNSSQQIKTLGVNRRQIIVGGVGIAGLATASAAGLTSANTQHPPAPAKDRANPNGRFAGKVVLITGAEQLDSYLARLGVNFGWLIIFDRRSKVVSIEECLTTQITITKNGRSVTVIRA